MKNVEAKIKELKRKQEALMKEYEASLKEGAELLNKRNEMRVNLTERRLRGEITMDEVITLMCPLYSVQDNHFFNAYYYADNEEALKTCYRSNMRRLIRSAELALLD